MDTSIYIRQMEVIADIMMYEMLFSATGRSEKVMNILSEEWIVPKVRVDLSDRNLDADKYKINAEDLCIFVTSVFEGRIPMPALENIRKIQGNGAKIVLVAVFGNRSIDDCLLHMKDVTVAQGFIPVAAIQCVAQHSCFCDIEPDRPNINDVDQLRSFTGKIKDYLSRTNRFSDLAVPGHRPYVYNLEKIVKMLKISGTHPAADDKCIECGLCEKNCPAGAIPQDNYHISLDDCINCMRCVEKCPTHARACSKEELDTMYTALKSLGILNVHKPNILYLCDE